LGVGGLHGAISGVTTFNRYVGENSARGVIRLLNYFLYFMVTVELQFQLLNLTTTALSGVSVVE